MPERKHRLTHIFILFILLIYPLYALADSKPNQEFYESLQLTDSERNWIASHPVIRFTGDPDWLPQEAFTDSGEYIGIVNDVLELLESRLPIRFERVVAGTWDQAVRMAESREVDMLSELSSSGREELTFTKPYIEFPVIILARQDAQPISNLAELEGKRTAVVREYGYLGPLRRKTPNIEYIEVDTVEDGLTGLSAGSFDAFIATSSTAGYSVNELGLVNLKTAGSTGLFTDLGFGVRKDWPELVSVLNKALAAIPQDEIQAIRSRWLGQGTEKALNTPDLSPEERRWVKENPIVRVSVTPDWPPFEYVDEENNYRGITVDVFRLAAERAGLSPEYVSRPWDELLTMLKERELDVAPGMVQTPERGNFLIFTEPFITSFDAIWTRDDTQDISSAADLTGKTVAVEKGYYTQETLSAKHPEIKLLTVSGTLEALRAVSSGRADAYVGTHAVGAYLIDRYLLTDLKLAGYFGDETLELRIGVRSDRPILFSVLSRALDTITESEIADIQSEYLSGEAAGMGVVTHLTIQEKEWLAKHRSIRLGVDPDWLPYEAIDDDGNYQGVISEYTAWVSKRLGITMEPVKGMTWPEVLEGARDGTIDLIPGLTASDERRKFLNFTEPYLTMPLVLITRENAPFVGGLTDLKGRRVAVVENYISGVYLERDHPDIEIVTVENIEKGLNDVLEGRADAMFDNLNSVTYAMRLNNIQGLKVAATTPYNFELSIGVRKDWPELVPILDKALAAIPRDNRQAFLNRWVNIYVASRVDWTLLWEVALALVLVAGTVLTVTLISNRRLSAEAEKRRQAEERTRLILDSAGEGVIGVDKQGRAEFINPAALSTLGFRAEEFIGRTIHDLIHHTRSDGRPYPPEECPMQHAFLEGRFGHVEDEMLFRKDGTGFPAEYTAAPIQSGDDVTGAVILFKDITERKGIEEELQLAKEEAEELGRNFTNFMESTSDLVYLKDTDLRYMACSKPLSKMLGYEDWRDIVGRTEEEVQTDNSSIKFKKEPELSVIEEGRVIELTEDIIRHGGKSGWVSTVKKPLTDGKGNIVGILSISRDITERIKMEEALKSERERLQGILDTSPVGVAITVKGIIRFANPRFREMFNVNVDDPIPDIYVKREERDVIMSKLKTAGKVYNYELQMYGINKEVRDMLATYLSVDYNGEDAILGWALDITDRKRTEQEIKEKYDELARFRRLAIGRELKMIDLKKEINAFFEKNGLPEKYKIH